jgi:cobalt/nickel transport system permease protein
MDLSQFKNVSNVDSYLSLIDGRIKTVNFLSCIVISAVISRWYLVVLLWLIAIIFFSMTKMKWNVLIRRLYLPFGLSWLVFLSVVFTNGSHILWSTTFLGIPIVLYWEGLKLGVLIQLRIMATVTFGSLLAFSTPMIEILETLRLCKFPTTIIDLAAMMYRYVFIIEKIAHNMHIAQVSRMGDRVSWAQKIKDTGKVAGYVIIKSIDKSVSIYNAMLSRGYNENTKSIGYFTEGISTKNWIFGFFMSVLLIGIITINVIT